MDWAIAVDTPEKAYRREKRRSSWIGVTRLGLLLGFWLAMGVLVFFMVIKVCEMSDDAPGITWKPPVPLGQQGTKPAVSPTPHATASKKAPVPASHTMQAGKSSPTHHKAKPKDSKGQPKKAVLVSQQKGSSPQSNQDSQGNQDTQALSGRNSLLDVRTPLLNLRIK